MTAYRMFAAASPPTAKITDSGGLSLGVEFSTSVAGNITAIWWWLANDAGTAARTVGLFTTDGNAVGGTTSVATGSPGWQQAVLTSPIAVAAGTRYVAVVFYPNNDYVATSNYFASSGPGASNVTSGPLTMYSTTNTTGGAGNGRYHYGSALSYTESMYNDANYWTDVTFDDGVAAATQPPPVQPMISRAAVSRAASW